MLHYNAPHWFAKIWRYMSESRFRSLVENHAIFLARADKFDDALEGMLSAKNQSARKYVYDDNAALRYKGRRLAREFELMKARTFVSCWRVDEKEHARCWLEYPKQPDAVAIQTNYLQLSRMAACYFCAAVEYVNHPVTWIPEGNSVYPFIHKDQKYEWEKEFRIVEQRLPREQFQEGSLRRCVAEASFGRILPIDLRKVVLQIVVSPLASDACADRVRALANQHGLAGRLRPSGLG